MEDSKTYEQVKKEILAAGDATTRINARIHSVGERILLKVQDRDESWELVDDKVREIEIAYYAPESDASKKPIVFGMHGGGFVVGGCCFDDPMWDAIRKEADCSVISIGYRKAPEYPYPAALFDVCDAVDKVLSCGNEYGIDFDRERVFAFGNSAGSTLAAASTLKFVRDGRRVFKGLLLNYPYLDLVTSPKNKGASGTDAMSSEVFREAYLNGQDPNEALVSPLYAADNELKDFPDAFISVCEKDELRAEGEKFERRLNKAGVPTEIVLAKGMPHAYFEYNFGKPSVGEKPAIAAIRADGSMTRESQKTLKFFAEVINRR